MATEPAPFFVLDECYKDRRAHATGDECCSACRPKGEYPKRHSCGGLMHGDAIEYSYLNSPHGVIVLRCDRCGGDSMRCRHATMTQQARTNRDEWVARCSCGWFEELASEEIAIAAALAHERRWAESRTP